MSQTPETNLQAQEAQEIAEVMSELEQYRQRIVNDVLEMARRIKLPQQVAIAHLAKNQEIVQIDAMLEELRVRQASLQSLTSVR